MKEEEQIVMRDKQSYNQQECHNSPLLGRGQGEAVEVYIL